MQYCSDGILEKILVKFPPETLVTFKRVCKSWNALISDPKFIRKNLLRDDDNNNKDSSLHLFLPKTLKTLLGSYRRKIVMSLLAILAKDDSDSDSDTVPCRVTELDIDPALKRKNLKASSHCDGVVCLSIVDKDTKRDRAILWNPLLGEFKLLRAPFFAPGFRGSVSGFGYDSRANDYKYVQLGFEVWNEQVVVFLISPGFVLSRSFEMWVLVENFAGVEGLTSWTKRLTIESRQDSVVLRSPLAFWKDDEILMVAEEEPPQIVSYNVSTRKVRRLGVPNDLLTGSMYAHSYTPSLVSVGPRNANAIKMTFRERSLEHDFFFFGLHD